MPAADPTLTTPDSEPEFLRYSPADITAMGERNGWDSQRTARALQEHRDNIAAYAHDNFDGETSWKAAAQLDRDTDEQLRTVHRNAVGQAINSALPDEQDRANFLYELEAGGFDPANIDPRWKPAWDAYEQTANDSTYQRPRMRSGGMLRVDSGAPLAAFNFTPRSDGTADVQLVPVGEGKPKFVNARVAIPTDEDIEAEIASAKQAFADAEAKVQPYLAADKASAYLAEHPAEPSVWDYLGGMSAVPEAAAADQRRTEALTAHGDAKVRLERLSTANREQVRQELFHERLKQQLADPKYRGLIGDYDGASTFLKGLVVDNGTAALALAARAGDAINGNEDLMREVNRIKQTYEEAYPDSTRRSLEGGLWNDVVTSTQRSGGQMLPFLASAGASKALLAGAESRGSLFAAEELAKQATGKLGMAGAGMGAASAGNAYLDTQTRIDQAEAAGDTAKAARLRAGRDIHALLTAASEAAIERIGGAQALNTTAKGVRGFTAEVLKEGVEEPLTGLVQRGLVEPLTTGDTPDVFAPMPVEALTGLMVAAPTQAVSSLLNRSPDNASVTDGTSEQLTDQTGAQAMVEGSTPSAGSSNLTQDQGILLTNLLRNTPGVDPAQAGMLALRLAPQIQFTKDASPEDIQAQVTAALGQPSPPPSNDTQDGEVLEGPRSLMDVARRAGRVDSLARLQTAEQTLQTATDPAERAAAAQAANTAEVEIAQAANAPQTGGRVQFAKKKPLANSYDEVRNGHPVRSIKQHILRAPDPMPRIAEEDLNEPAATLAVGQMIEQTPVITDAQGKRVLLANPDTPSRGAKPTIAHRIAHLIASYAKEDRYKQGPRIFNRDKASTAIAVPTTVADYHIKAHDPKTRQTLYLRRYADGNLHAVITDRESRVTDFGEVQGGLTTQRSPKPIEAFDGFFVEDKRTPGATVPPLDTRRGTQTQKAASSLTPQTQITHRNQQSKRFVPGVPLNQKVRNTRTVAQQAARLLNRQLPGIMGPKLTFFANPEELLASDYAGKDSFTEAELAQMQDAEGFYDNDTGHTIIFTDAIEVRPGESERAAVARVILHERVGHDGFNALLLDPEFRQTWETLAAKIPEAELDAIIHDGYAHLAADRHQLALEWFARAVEKRLHLKEGLARRLWLALKSLIHRIRSPFTKSDPWTHEADLMALINKAREAAQNGTAIPTTADGLRARMTEGPSAAPAAALGGKAINETIDAFNRILASGQGASAQIPLPNLGTVTVEWGNPGNPARRFKQGYGLSHIIARRVLIEGKDAVQWLQQLARTLHHGVQSAPYGQPGNPRIDISLGGQRAVISLERHGQTENWLLTAFDDASAAGATSGNVHPSSATHIRPSFTHADVVAAAKLQLPHFSAPSTQRIQFALGGTRVFEEGGNRPFRVNNLGLRTLLTGSALPKAFHETVQATERERRALDQVAAQIGLDLKTAIEAHAKTANLPLAQVYDMVHQAMNGAPGTNAVLLATNPTLAERARVARNFIDDMSVAIANTLPKGELRNRIILNQGSWMRRQYACFDPASGWNFDNVMKAAREGKAVGTRQARSIVAAAAAYISRQNGYAANQRDANGLPRVGSVLEADLRDLMDRDTFAEVLTGSAAVRKNVSSLISRKEIPAELRAVMGEETNPLKQFLGSTSFQAQFLQRHQQQIALRTIGLANNLFVTRRAGVFTQEIPADNPRWSPLAGLYTTPQLWKALQKVDGTERGNDFWSGLGKALQWLGAEAKLNKVAMNPDSWVVNAAGGMVALVQTGDVFSVSFFSRMAEAVRLHRAGKTAKSAVGAAAADAVLQQRRRTIARLTAEGVLGNTLTSRDLEASMDRSLLQWVELEEQTLKDRLIGAAKGAIYGNATGRSLGVAGRVVGGTVGALAGATAGNARIRDLQARLADLVMTGPDTVARLTGFLGNLETALAAGLRGSNAHAYAVERTRNTFPDYSKLPSALRTLSKYGLAGSFVAFQWEVYRNAFHNLRYARQDLMSGNPAMQVRGAKRIIGASMLGYLAAGGLQALFQNAAGTDDERNRKWRKWFAAPWEKHAVLAFTDYSPESVTYFNTSYLIPQTTIAELAVAASAGEDPLQVVGSLVGQGLSQFFGSSVHLQPLMEAAMNQDRAGRDITQREGTLGGTADKLEHIAKATLEPGWTQKVERLIYAYREAERRGRKFSFEEEFARFAGIRSFTRSWPDMVKRRYDGFARDYAAIRNEANETLAQNLPGAKAKAIATAAAKIQELTRQLAEYEADLPTLGVPGSMINTARKDSSVPTKFRLFEIDPETGNRVRSVKD